MLRSEIEIMKNWEGDKDSPLLSICCTAYNHENYINEALDGFLLQETDFPFEIIVRDDASDDNTAEVIKQYKKKFPNIIKPIYETTNQYTKGVRPMLVTFKKALGKYLALCNGDDYWIDKNKLQKQVDFLDENEDYGLVSTLRKIYHQVKGEMRSENFTFKEPFKTYTFDEIIIESKIVTSTTVFRRSLMLDYLKIREDNKSKLSSLDYCYWMYFSYKMKIAILKDITTVYRVLPESASHSSDISKRWALRKKYYKDFKFFISFLPDIPPSLINKAEYFRAKGHYILAGKSNDIDTCKELLKIFKNNNDRIRYIMLKIFMKIPKLFNIALLYEKINRRLLSQ